MANRTTVKSKIVELNVPSVSNAILNNMLNDQLADNVRFREDHAMPIVKSEPAFTLDFTGVDRIDLNRTGGSLAITVTGMGDGETKFLLITKTPGQAVTFVGVTDITPVKANADILSLVLYEIVRKGSYFFAKAWVESPIYSTETVQGVIKLASTSEHNALVVIDKACVPGKLPIASETQQGLIRKATTSEAQAYVNDVGAMTSLKTKQLLDAVVSGQLMDLTGKVASLTANFYDARKIGRLIHFELNIKTTIVNSYLQLGTIPGYVPLHGGNCGFIGQSDDISEQPANGFITQASNIFVMMSKANTNYIFNFNMIV